MIDNKRKTYSKDRKRKDHKRETKDNYLEKIIKLKRVVKVIKSGRDFSFLAFVVVGNKNGLLGYGSSKAAEPVKALMKSNVQARKNMKSYNIYKGRIPYIVEGKFDSSTVILKPAVPGTGLVANNVVRSILTSLGVHDVVSKCYGSSNSISIMYATIKALESIVSIEDIAALRGKDKNIFSFVRTYL